MTLAEAVARWSLTALTDLAETRTSRLWCAESAAYGAAVLKILKPYGADEIHGVHLMQALAGQGAARIFDVEGDAILMEYLPGPLLGDLVRQGQDDEATKILADVAAQISRVDPPKRLVGLERHFEALFEASDAAFPELPVVRNVARRLLESMPDPRPLHGDLHHDNILHSPRGWLAIDPKGLLGDPAYEFANSFRNPFDCQPNARNPERIQRLAKTYAARTDVLAARILSWAAVHCAISICWDLNAKADTEDDRILLPLLLSAAEIG